MLLRPPFYFAIATFVAAAILVVSSVRLGETADEGGETWLRWVSYTVVSATALLGFLVMLFGRQLPALVYAAVVSRTQETEVVLVSGRGSPSLIEGYPFAHGFFTRCLVSDRQGLRLWSPFTRSSLRWADLVHVRVEGRVEVPSRAVAIVIVRSGPSAKLQFDARAGSALEWVPAKREEIENQVRSLLKLGEA